MNMKLITEPEAGGGVAPVQRFGFLLVSNFSLIALGAAVDPLRLANTALGRTVFEYVTLGVQDEPIMSSDGIRVLPDKVIGETLTFDTIFVVGPNPIPNKGFAEVTRWLRKLAAQGVTLGGIDTGSYYLAKAGLLNDYRCTIHWEDRDALISEFPRLNVTTRLFEIDRDRYTCSGGVSPLDLMTFVLGRPPGSRELAQQVSELLVSQQRSFDESQSSPIRYRYANLPEVLLEALEMMENNVEEPLSPAEIADYLKISRRQLERQFQAFVKTSPSRKYLEIRLARARLSVMRTTRHIDDIAQACGFSSSAHFISCYRDVYGITPQAQRLAFV